MTRELVGREDELVRLGELLAAAREGRGSLVLLAGEPGIGKTTLADALTRRAQRDGVRVLWGRCVEAGGQPAWWPFTQALGALVEHGAVDRKLVASLGGAILNVLPEAASLAPELVPLSAPETDTAAFAVARATTRLLRACAARTPSLLAIDDLHAADPATLRLLSVIAGEARAMPLLVVATLRDVEARQREDVRPLFDEVMRGGQVFYVSRLDDAASHELLALAAPDLPAAVADRAVEAAGGNPLFLGEVGALLAAHGHAGSAIPVPLGVRETLRSRLAELPADARAFIDALAVLGGEAPAERVAAVAGLASGAAAAAAASTVGLLHASADQRVRVSHGLVREVAYADLDPRRRAAMHVAAADALSQIAGGGPEILTEIARHLLAGGQPAVDRAISASLAAAGAALRRAHYEDAIAVLEAARAASEAHGVPAALRAELAIELGRALMRAGRLDEGRALCEGAAALADEAGDADLVARSALARGSVFQFGHVDRGLVSGLQRAAELRSGRADALEARVLARLAAAEQPTLNDTAAPIARAKRAFAMARALGDPETLLHVLHDGMAACMDFDHPRDRRAFNLELRELAQRLGEPWYELRALARLVFDFADVGETADADTTLDALDAVARRFSHPQHQWPVLLLRAMRAAFEGKFELAERFATEAIAFGGDDPRLRFTLFGHRHAALLAAERPEDARELAVEEGARVLTVPGGELLLGTLQAIELARLGDADGVRRQLPTIVKSLAFEDPAFTSIIGELAVFVGDRSLCEQVRAALGERGDWFASHGAMWSFVAEPLARVTGLLEVALGDVDAGIEHLDRAVALLRAANGRGFLARSLLDLADALRARGGDGDTARAAACAAEAAALADELDQVGLRSRLAVYAGGARPSSASTEAPLVPAAAPFTLTREGDMWTLRRGDKTLRLKDGRGVRILSQLVERPGEDVHVLDLVEGRAGGAVDAGDAGELLDARARAEYRARLTDVREELDEAERMGDLGSLERLRAEAEMLESELSRAFAFGGSSRRAGAAAERARSAVTRRVKETIKRIRSEDPELGAHLAWAVKTGLICAYRPEISG